MKAKRVQSAECRVQSAKWKHGTVIVPVLAQSSPGTFHFALCTRHFALPILLLFALGANRVEGKRIEGFTEPAQTIAVAAAENGIVQEVRVDLGQSVKKGEILGTLDDDLLKATLKIAELKAEAT